jgi:hypothetical protein
MAVEQSESMPHFADHLFPFQLAAQHQPSRQECNREHEPVCLERQVDVAAKNEIDQVGDLREIYSKCKIKIYSLVHDILDHTIPLRPADGKDILMKPTPEIRRNKRFPVFDSKNKLHADLTIGVWHRDFVCSLIRLHAKR